MQSPMVPAVAAALLVAALWILHAFSASRTRRRFVAIERAFHAYAEAHGLALLRFSQMSGDASDVGPPLVRGEVNGVAVELTVHRSMRTVTRVEALLPSVSGDFTMVICPEHERPPRAYDGLALARARTGNKAFDAAFALWSNDPDLARNLVDRRLAHVVMRFPRAFVDLGARERRFLASWRGMETDPAVLDAAVEVVFTACRRRA